ncbi:MAG: putative beta-lysine N-acetyltransferase [Desulfobacterales bacterium]|nr:putative beta-lysine N-acetyltransferase [Desulfobacterales bacterium]
MIDRIEKMRGSIIQHGPQNNRIYLMRLNADDPHGLVAILDDMAVKNGYGKIFAKIPAPAWNVFKSANYIKEAVIPQFFAGKIDGFFIAKFFSVRRQMVMNVEDLLKFAKPAKEGPVNDKHRAGKITREVVSCNPSNAEEMSMIYQQVFKSYPFPIQNPNYLKHIMKEGVLYFCIRIEGRMAAIAGLEIDLVNQNAEMTDFATLPKWRGKGLAGKLLSHMEHKAQELGIKTVYTIARARSRGMNFVFKKSGYNFSGLLKNNSQICGSIQSMTVWYKHI